jgi:MFS family permease
MGLGLTFFGWGIAVAITSVWVAPWLTRRIPRSRVLWTVLLLLGVDLVLAGVFVDSVPGLITCVVAGGALLGVMNTVLTESVMAATDLPRPVASSAYSAVRFIGGAVAPPAASLIAGLFTAATPFYVAAGSVVIASIIVIAGHRAIAHIDHEEEDELVEAEAITAGE